MADDRTINELKDVEFYAAQVNAWVNTRFEHDKSLLTLSAGGVGLLITLLTNNSISSIELFVFYILALLSFVVCLGALLWIFKRNAMHLENVVQDIEASDSLLKGLDTIAIVSFLMAVVFSSIIGIITAAHSYAAKECCMSEKNQDVKQVSIRESFDGIHKMKPTAGVSTERCSIDGISSMKPSTAGQPSQAPAPVKK